MIFFRNEKCRRLLKDSFVIISLYVDEKRLTDTLDWVVKVDGDTLKHMGRINAHHQRYLFNTNAQPMHYILSSSGKLVSDGFGYNPSTKECLLWLEGGLENSRLN